MQFASDRLRNDKHIVLASVTKAGLSLEFVSAVLRGNKEVVLVAVEQHGDALEYTTAELRNTRDVVLVACSSHGLSLRFVAPALCHDHDIKQKNGLALQYALGPVSKDVALTAVANCGYAIQFCTEANLLDHDITLTACKSDGFAIQFCPWLWLLRLALKMEWPFAPLLRAN